MRMIELTSDPIDCQSHSFSHEKSLTSFSCYWCFVIWDLYGYMYSVLLIIRTLLASIQKDSLWLKLLEKRFLCSIAMKFPMHLRFLSISKSSNILWSVACYSLFRKGKKISKLLFFFLGKVTKLLLVHLDYSRSWTDCESMIYHISSYRWM